MWGGINWEVGIGIDILLYTKWVSNKDLLYSTGKSIQYSVIAYMVKESEKEHIYIYGLPPIYIYIKTDSL